MAFHFMLIMSHYHNGSRIGWHYASEDHIDKKEINDFLIEIKKRCGNIQFGIHKLSTNSIKLSSVLEKDSFFADVIFTSDKDRFIELVTSDREITAKDIAKFILSIWPSSHLKLQKLLYYCYAEFLLRTGEKLFKEPIVAYKYGPVVETVFDEFKIHGHSIIDYQERKIFYIKPEKLSATPSFIKLVLSEHGPAAIECVLDVIEKYASEKPFELVNRTHKKGGPWDRVYVEGANIKITDDIIFQYHEYVR